MFRKIRFYTRLLGAFLIKYYTLMVVAMVVGSVSFIFAPKLYQLFPKFRSREIVAVIGRYSLTDIPLEIQRQISGGLTKIDSSGRALPNLAQSWDVSPDGRSYTFKLRQGVKWQDGTQVISRDLNYHFRDVEIEYPDDYTLKIKLAKSYAALPVSLDRPIFKKGLLGWGDSKVSSIKKNGLLLEELVLDPVNKKLDTPRIIYRFYHSNNLAKLAFKLGLVNVLEEVPRLDEMTYWPHVKISEVVHKDRYLGVFFNVSTLDKSLRQALSYAIDKNRWPNRAIGPLSPLGWAYNSDIKPYDFDPNKARGIIAKLDKQPDTIVLSTLPVYLDVAEAIKKDWENVGLKVKVESVNSIPSDFTAMLFAQVTPIDPDQYNLWHSTQGTNYTRLDNKRIDKLLEDGRTTLDFSIRKEIYHDFQKFLLEEAPVAFLYYQTTYTVKRK